MNKMLLLLVSGLLLVCMAGSAVANPAAMNVYFNGKLLSPNVGVSVTPGQEATFDVKVYDIAYSLLNPNVNDMTRTVTVSCVGDVKAQIQLPGSSDWTTLAPTTSGQYTLTRPYAGVGDANTVDYKVKFIANSVGAVQIKDEGPSDNDQTSSVNFDLAAETHEINVPEFPTVALPIAALIGLVFIFGRRKEGL